MNLLNKIHQQIALLSSEIKPNILWCESSEIIYTTSLLYYLAEKQEWSDSDKVKMNMLSKSFDINKKLWLEYDQKGRKVSKDIIMD